MSYVWEHSSHKGTELLLLLAIANIANTQGLAHPGVKRLASDIRMSERNTQRALQKLVASGELTIKPNAGPHGCHVYQLNINETLPLFAPDRQGDKLSPDKLTGDTRGPKGVTSRASRGDTAMSPEPKEPSTEPKAHVPTASPVGKSPAAKAFNDYRGAFYERYQVEPPVSAKVRGQFAQLVARVGAEHAAKVAVAYVRDDNEFYRRVKHTPGILLKDCERIDIELRQAERAEAAREDRWWEQPAKVAERAQREGIKPEQGDSYARVAARLFVKLGDGPWMHKLDNLTARYVREYSERGVPA